MNENIAIKAILFDLVGTLIYVKGSVGLIYSSVAESFGFEIDSEKLNKAFIEAIHIKPQPIGGNEEEKKWWKEVVSNTFKFSGYDLKEKFNEIFEIIFKEFTTKGAWAVYPEVFNVLKNLQKNNLKIGLISNFDNRLEIILKELEIYECFNCLSYSGKVGFSKPDPRIFQYALKELNIIPEEALYIGDSLETDYYPALNLNMNAYLIVRSRGLLQQAPTKGIRTISNLNQIFDFIEV